MKELWRRVLLPATVPIVALAIIAFSVLNISRVLIAVEESNSPGLVTMLAVILTALVLGTCVYLSTREAEKRKHNEGAILAFSGMTLLVCGLWGYQAIDARSHEGGEVVELGPVAATVHAFDLGFEEKELSVAPGEVVFEYVNKGTQAHTLLIEGVAGKLEVGSKGATDEGAFALEPGEYVYFCDVAGHRPAGMEGKLTVAEGAGGAGGGTTVEVGDTLAFTPAQITVPEGPTEITLKHTGSLPHTFVIDGVPAFKKLAVATKDESVSGTLDAPAGEYTFYCDVPGHRQAGMEGKIKVGGA